MRKLFLRQHFAVTKTSSMKPLGADQREHRHHFLESAGLAHEAHVLTIAIMISTNSVVD